MTNAEVLYRFWFGEGSLDDAKYVASRMKIWFGKDQVFDERIRDEFAHWLDYPQGNWKSTPRDFLSLILLHDQIPRNAFRGTRRAFAYDTNALELTKEAISRGYHETLHVIESVFLLLPLEHSEASADQQLSVKLMTEVHRRVPQTLAKVTESTLDYARRHAEVIERFGRFPHRNAILGRENTPEETEFLKQPGSGF